MMENEFLNSVRIEQFIKNSNDQLEDTIKSVSNNINVNMKSILKNQQTQITSLSSIDKTTKSLDKNMSKILSNQDKMIKALSGFKGSKESVTISNLKDIKKLVSKDSPKRDTFRREDPNKETHDLLGNMNKSLGALVDRKEKGGGGLLRMLMMSAGGVLAGSGLLGFLLTGKVEGLQAMAKGMAKSFDGLFRFGKGTFKVMKNIPKAIKGIGNIVKSVGRFKKVISRVGLGKGAKMLGGRAMKKGLAKAGTIAGLKKIPGIGSLLNVVFAVQKFSKGDFVGGLLELSAGAADFIPILGPFIGIALDMISLKRDLTISKSQIASQREVIMNPVGAVKAIANASTSKSLDKKRVKEEPIKEAARVKLQQLTNEEKQGFRAFRAERGVTQGSTGQEYSDAVDAYFESLGKGGGGFQFSDEDIMKGNGKYNTITSVNSEEDDNYTKGNSKSALALSRALVKLPKYRKKIKLNPAYNVDLMGLNSTMRKKFLSMASKFHDYTGGYLLVNSAKRTGGTSVHNKGYAIDVNAMTATGKRYGDGYVPENFLKAYGFHRPLLHYRSMYGGPKDEGWHIEPFPGEDTYGGPRNTLAQGQPYRKGVLLAGGNGYEKGGGGFDNANINMPQGNVPKPQKSNEPTNVSLSQGDIDALAIAFGKQMQQNIQTQQNVSVVGNTSSPRSNL